jgi:hypothetical protein
MIRANRRASRLGRLGWRALAATITTFAMVAVATPAHAATQWTGSINCQGTGSGTATIYSLAAGHGANPLVEHANWVNGVGWAMQWYSISYQQRWWVANIQGVYFPIIDSSRVRTNSGGIITTASIYCSP